VCNHVVHLARDPGPLGCCREKRLLISFELESCGALDEACEMRPTCPDIEAGDKGGYDEAGQEGEGRKRRLVQPHCRKDRSAFEDASSGDRRTPRALGGNGVERHEERDIGSEREVSDPLGKRHHSNDEEHGDRGSAPPDKREGQQERQ